MGKKSRQKRQRTITQQEKQRHREKTSMPDLEAPAAPEPAGAIAPAVSAAALGSDGPLLLTIADLCRLLQVSRSTLHRMAASGKIPGRITLGAQVRYHRPTVEAWFRELAGGADNDPVQSAQRRASGKADYDSD
jgi:excisionase family DNA binding protein